MSSCALFDHCRNRISHTVRALGDEAADAFGPTTELGRLYELMRHPERAQSAEDVMLAARFREAMVVLGLQTDAAVGKVSVR